MLKCFAHTTTSAGQLHCLIVVLLLEKGAYLENAFMFYIAILSQCSFSNLLCVLILEVTVFNSVACVHVWLHYDLLVVCVKSGCDKKG